MNTYLFKHLKIKMPWLVGSGGGVGLGTGQGMEVQHITLDRGKRELQLCQEGFIFKGLDINVTKY